MLNFELSKTKPKLQNNSIVALQTKKQFFSFFLLFLLCCSTVAYSQDIPKKEKVNIPAETENDTIAPSQEINMLPETVADTVKTDTIRPPKEYLTTIVDYYGEDYVYLDRKNNKVYMYNKAYVIYGDMRIDAGLIILDYNKNEVFAKGIDSAGVYSQAPVFVQGQNKVEPDSLRFNFDSQKAIVFNSRTDQNGFKVKAEITKKVNDSVYFLRNVKFTTSKNIEDPEYYFYTRKAKFVPKEKIVTGLTNMFIADVPTPLGLPFAYFPLTEERTSGFILPSIGEQNRRGFFFQNGGYYFAVSEYFDFTLLGDYYTNGSYGLRGESAYYLKYRFRGNVSVRYENLINGERGFSDFSQSTLYNIQWSHQQDQKASPSSRFSARVNLGSSDYFTQSINQINNASTLVNTLSSSVSYTKTFEGEPQVNLSVAATHSQNTQTENIVMSLPNLDANMSRVFPFAPKVGVKKGIIDNINFQYNLSAENRINTADSLFFKRGMFENALIGARHSIPISTNFKILKFFSATAGTNLQETWVGNTISRTYDPEAQEGLGGVVTDTIRGFDSYRTYDFRAGLGTTVYGTFNFGEDKKIQAIRHLMQPEISYNINPSFSNYYDDFTIPSADPEVVDEIREFSRFENTLYGAPRNQYSSNIGFSVTNTVEAKVRSRDTTATEPTKLTLLSNLTLSTAYNLSGDSLKLDPLRVRGSIPVIEKLEINFNANLDPYALSNNNRRIDKLNINNGGSLFRLTDANLSMNYSFSSKDFETKNEDTDRINDVTFRNGGRPDDLFGQTNGFDRTAGGFSEDDDDDDKEPVEREWYNYSIPWDVRLAYTITYSNALRQSEISSQSLMFSTNLELSPRWAVGVSSGYDFKNQGITLTQLRFERDLESWRMSFNWTPIGRGINSAWYFFIGIKSSVLSDIKYDKNREPDQQL